MVLYNVVVAWVLETAFLQLIYLFAAVKAQLMVERHPLKNML